MKATISVVIPTYNAARYLPEALESVFAQTFPADEVIVVDDGSTDDTPSVLAGYGSRIKTIRKENGGIGSARNAGVRIARGNLIAFLDADDLWLPDKLDCQVQAMRPEDMLCGASGSQGVTTLWGQYFEVRRVRHSELLINNPFSASSVMIRRWSIDMVGAFEERRVMLGVEDWDLWLRITRQFRSILVYRPLARIRQVEGSVSSLPNTEVMLKGELAVLDKQAAGYAGYPHKRLLLRKAKGYRYFCAAWGMLMQGDRLQARRYMLSCLRLYPLWILCRKPAGLVVRLWR